MISGGGEAGCFISPVVNDRRLWHRRRLPVGWGQQTRHASPTQPRLVRRMRQVGGEQGHREVAPREQRAPAVLLAPARPIEEGRADPASTDSDAAGALALLRALSSNEGDQVTYNR